MYFEYFGLKKNPFRITPDEDFLYLLDSHKRSYAYLKYTAWANDGFMLLTGEIGTGKTLLLKKLSSELGKDIKIVNISQTQLEVDDLLRILLYELTGSFEASSRAELIIRVRMSLLERKKEKEKTLLILDEAQNLNKECLEEIRLLADEMHDGENLLNIILSGQPEIEYKIDRLGLEQLQQRIRITYRLTALKESDVGSYIDFRTFIGYGYRPLEKLKVQLLGNLVRQVDPPIFSRLFDVDVSKIYNATRGVPRLINSLCETAIVLAYGENTSIVSGKIIKQALDELGWLINEDGDDVEQSPTDANGKDYLKIEVSLDGDDVDSIRVDKLPFSIGRDNTNDLVLKNKTVSKQHAILTKQSGSLVIKDTNSTNGVKINGLKVIAHTISNGEIAQIGRYKLRFLVGHSFAKQSDTDTVKTVHAHS
jgi:type II secretory pathway predicted ATPase ExeA